MKIPEERRPRQNTLKEDRYINKKFEHDRSAFNPYITGTSRIYLIAEEIAKGSTFKDIVVKYGQEWSVTPNYIAGIINEAIGLFKDESYYKNIRDINNERLNQIYKEACERKDLNAAIKAIDTLNKQNGVYDVQTKATTVQVQTPADETIIVTFGGQESTPTPIVEAPTNIVNDVEELINETLKE